MDVCHDVCIMQLQPIPCKSFVAKNFSTLKSKPTYHKSTSKLSDVTVQMGLIAFTVSTSLWGRYQKTARRGIAQLTLQRLTELCETPSKAEDVWRALWSSLRAGISPLESPFSQSSKASRLSEMQREMLRSFDEVFAAALKPEAVELCLELDTNISGSGTGVFKEADKAGDTKLNESPLFLTHKFLLRLHDGLSVESVLIPPKVAMGGKVSAKATTICISSQVGCAQACRFCRTGHMGLLRNLGAEEIIAQVVHGRRLASELGLPKVLKVVFMGMGEPLANLSNVKLAVEALSDANRMGFARKRIQISTVGPSPSQILQLKGMRCQFVWSLHSANDSLRSQLVPTSRFSMVELRSAFADLLRSGQPDRFMVAVVMIAGVNDTPRHATELAEFLRPLYDDPQVFLSINLIPYNQNPQDDFRAPDAESVERFRQKLNEVIPSLTIHVRQTRGAKSSAACGQLATTARA